jgi:glycosyltransferase involved in cell wall biosynthesis
VLCIAGDPGAPRAELARTARRAGVEKRVVFLGRLTDEDLAAAYRAADVFVSASSYEGFGLPAPRGHGVRVSRRRARHGGRLRGLEDAALVVEEETPPSSPSPPSGSCAAPACGGPRRPRTRAGRELSWERTAARTHALYRSLTDGAERAA